MKSITVTTLRSINFGAALQAYALHRFQKKLGIDNYLLDTKTPTSLYEKPDFFYFRSGVLSIVSNIILFVHRKSARQTLSNFTNFINENIKLTKVYDTYDEIIKDVPKADLYVCGSDQVLGLRGFYSKLRLLEFAPKNSLKISYAGSLGEYDWSEEEQAKFKSIIQTYSAVSVREQCAKDYLDKIANISCLVNIDPVLLLEKNEWEKVCGTTQRPFPEKYILCYPLLGNEDLQNVVNELKEKTNYAVVYVDTLPFKRLKADHYVFNAGPKEFVNLVRCAECVVTTSFHGTVFSILFQKPFYTLVKSYKHQRMTHLLGLLHLSDRLYKKGSSLTLNIDYKYANEVIKQERVKSTDFFRSIISKCK